MSDKTTPPPQDERTAHLPELREASGDGSTFDPGTMVGPYRILERLGAGGMGDVWLAEQIEPIQRKVALKLIQRQLLGGLAEAYFEVERQALARMDHPAIAKVFDAGRTAHGFPYFAMERIDGVPMQRWRRERDPSLSERLRLMIALARGVQHAHQRGVVHRDLKPNNVLVTEVDGLSQPKIIDFGIAVGIGDQPSQSGPSSYSVAGTAMYMSPEQAEGHAEGVDTRSDVYALGMILLGLLLPAPGLKSLGPEFPSAAELHGALSASLLRGSDPAPRMTLLRGIPWELRHLLRVALAPERGDRLESAEHMAEELERFLASRALDSVPPSALYRSARFMRRHRLAFAAGALVVLSLLIGLGAALHGMWRAEQEAQRSRAMADFMADVLTGVDPDRARGHDRALLNLILEEAAERARSRSDLDPSVLVDIEGVIGGTYDSLGDYVRAVEFTEQAFERGAALLGADDPRTLHQARRYSDALSNRGQFADGERVAAEALARALRHHPDEHRLIGNLQMSMGWAQRELGRLEEALAALHLAAANIEHAGPDSPDDAALMNARYIEAIVLSDLERFDEAEPLLRQLIDERIAIDGAGHPRTLRLRNSLAVILLQSRRYADAEPVLRAALEGSEKTFGPEHSSTLGAVSNLGGALRQQGKIEESGTYYRRALEGLTASIGAEHPRTLLARHNHANFLLDNGQPEDALAEQQRVLELAKPVWDREHMVTSEILGGIGKALIALGRLDEAEATINDALAIKRRVVGDRHRTIDNLEAELARIEALRDDP